MRRSCKALKTKRDAWPGLPVWLTAHAALQASALHSRGHSERTLSACGTAGGETDKCSTNVLRYWLSA